MNVMAKDSEEFAGFGRYAGPATLILASLADGTKHGYALTKDIESFAGVRLAPGTLYEALAPGPGAVRLPCSAATATGRTCPPDGPGRPP